MREKKSKIRSFEDLEVWQLARTINKDIFKLVKTFPETEKYRLTDQMIRSSRSISDNIAEGYGRFHYQENIQFCRQSRGSTYELINHLITAFDCKYIDDNELKYHRNRVIPCIKLINGYIRYLHKAKSDSAARDESIPYLNPNFELDIPNNE